MATNTSRSANVVTDHEKIRHWAESQGGRPARVIRTGRGARKGSDTGIIRIDFPGFSGEKSLEPISWDEWFDAFEKNRLALLISNNPRKPRFNKLIRRDSAGQTRARRKTTARKTTGRKTTGRKRATKRATAGPRKKTRRSAARR